MSTTLRLAVICFCLVLACTLASAEPIVIYPNPVVFGTVDLSQTGNPVIVFVSNTSSSSVTISGMTITGTNSADFAFDGYNCVGTISASQTCNMYMIFTPSAIGARSAQLTIAVIGSGTISIPLDGTGGNPLPTITSISPPTGYVGSASVKLTVNGTGFLSTSVVYFNNSPIVTTYVNASKLTALIPAADLTNTNSAYVYVSNLGPGGGSSGSLNFEIISPDPQVQSASPASLVAGTTSTAVVVNGNSFMSGATVTWNGTALPTTFISSQQLQATISTADLAHAQIAQLAVSNPAPGTLSGPVTFNVTYPASVRILDLPANSLVWDPFAQLIYASIPSSYGANGNSIATINPLTGGITGYHFAGSEPNQLALSSTASYIYAGLNGNGSLERYILPGFTPDINVNLGENNNSVNTALSLAVSPADAHTFGVSLSGCCGNTTVEFFKDTTKLANSITNTTLNDLVFANSTTLYGYNGGTLSEVNVSSTGGTLGKQWSGYLEGSAVQYDAGLFYSSDGEAFNPATGDLMGTFDVGNSGCCNSDSLVPNAPINRVLAIGSTPFSNGFGITNYNLTDFTPIAVTSLAEFNNSPYGNSVLAPVLWGSNGLAFILQAGCCGNVTSQVVLVQSASMFQTAPSNNKVPTVTSLSPISVTHGSGNFVLTVKGSNFFPGSTVTWNGKHLTSSYVNSTQLKVYVPRADIVSPGTAVVALANGSSKLASAIVHFTIK